MTLHYILVGHEPKPEPDPYAWAAWFETADRVVAQTNVSHWIVSTVFLGIDHDFTAKGPPILFETMIFPEGTSDERYTDRYPTWNDAVAGHAKAIRHAETLEEPPT